MIERSNSNPEILGSVLSCAKRTQMMNSHATYCSILAVLYAKMIFREVNAIRGSKMEGRSPNGIETLAGSIHNTGFIRRFTKFVTALFVIMSTHY